jgi:hypothetical protein
MACHTFDASKNELEHGIEFCEERGKRSVPTIKNGSKRHINFCSEYPPKRVNALTLLCGQLYDERIRKAKDGDVALIHVHHSQKIIPIGEVIILGQELALVQLIPGTGILVQAKNGSVRITFKNGQLFKEAA